MLPWLTDRARQPLGRPPRPPGRARRAIDDARDVVAALARRRPGEVVFTGGGTEADNLAVFGTSVGTRRRAPAVLQRRRAPRRARRRRARVGGRDSSPSTPRAGSTSTRWPTRSTTTVAPRVGDAGQQRGRHRPAPRRRWPSWSGPRAPARCCTPTPCRPCTWLDVADAGRGADLVSLSAPTSSAGPRASARSSCATASRCGRCCVGGGQERERRSGTHNVAGIVGAGRGGRWRPRADARADDSSAPGRRAARPARRRAGA